MSAWQPIKTAPRDGTKFLAHAANGRMRVDWLDESQSSGADRYWQEHADNRYTHWMPLPEPPSP